MYGHSVNSCVEDVGVEEPTVSQRRHLPPASAGDQVTPKVTRSLEPRMDESLEALQGSPRLRSQRIFRPWQRRTHM